MPSRIRLVVTLTFGAGILAPGEEQSQRVPPRIRLVESAATVPENNDRSLQCNVKSSNIQQKRNE